MEGVSLIELQYHVASSLHEVATSFDHILVTYALI